MRALTEAEIEIVYGGCGPGGSPTKDTAATCQGVYGARAGFSGATKGGPIPTAYPGTHSISPREGVAGIGVAAGTAASVLVGWPKAVATGIALTAAAVAAGMGKGG
ncbi:hypothetical protein [Nostoc favosum]|uniref:Uncharacterized protein n=1 Tax=Nostoc favosum CHAB5714 TaxID=2780399 RepID=A0ABS8IKG5_9NOSO|nr:hypothetical protein [Nostoc favosum]MCC5604778.1 hypothetical protein [Nostoc favosum CHAB5714]